jgi:hypothetical protein
MNVIPCGLVSSTILHSATPRDMCSSRAQNSFTLRWKPEIMRSKTIFIECNVFRIVPFYILWVGLKQALLLKFSGVSYVYLDLT